MSIIKYKNAYNLLLKESIKFLFSYLYIRSIILYTSIHFDIENDNATMGKLDSSERKIVLRLSDRQYMLV